MEEKPLELAVVSPFDPNYDGELIQGEVYWVEHQRFLESQGYMLRERYRPGWTPSWKGTKKCWAFCRDGTGFISVNPNIMDATIIETGKKVMLKRVSKDIEEFNIMKQMSLPSLRDDPRNHCIPLLSWIEAPDDPEMAIMVMPRLHDNLWEPFFERVSEIIEYYEQVLEGLVFMHEQNLGHRDCCWANIVMDAARLFPPDYDIIYPFEKRKPLPRRSHPIKYYFIDFGLSSIYASFEDRRMEVFPRGQYKEAPELSIDEPYDAFMLDVWCVGFIFYEQWLQYYEFLDFMTPLIDWMMQNKPLDRPTASQAFTKFKEIRSQIPNSILNLGLSYKSRDSWGEQIMYYFRRRVYKKWQASLSSTQSPHRFHNPVATN